MIGWRVAMQQALYGERGFFVVGAGPSAHFRTSVHASPLFAAAILQLATRIDEALCHPPTFHLVDVGAGGGELLTQVLEAAGTTDSDLADRIAATAVELGLPPEHLDPRITWTTHLPQHVTGLVVTNEWLDNVPVDVVEQTQQGPRVVLVDPVTGDEALGPSPTRVDLEWLASWWPLREPGERAEVGTTRDAAWARVIESLDRGVAVAIDYAVDVERHRDGTLTGYRQGRQVRPAPDGSCDITAHVLIASVAEAGRTAGATHTLVTTQRDALDVLGICATKPPRQLASSDPTGYLRELSAVGQLAELRDPAGLGGFTWLLQSVGVEPPLSRPDPT